MKEFEYRITDKRGLHARPAAKLVEYARKSDCKILITKGQKTVSAERLLELMGLLVVQGDRISITVVGEREEEDFLFLQAFFKNNL